MSNLFVANPAVLRQEGGSIQNQAGLFGQNIEKIYSTLDELLSSGYISPAAMAIGQKIRDSRDDLDMMKKVIDDYANYCMTTSATVVKNEQNIIDNYTNRG
ncbi:MAG: hypothetical protein IJ399_02140 [Bacilli bacterium]|nr:hypothetical protein [Bacilli bacterium]